MTCDLVCNILNEPFSSVGAASIAGGVRGEGGLAHSPLLPLRKPCADNVDRRGHVRDVSNATSGTSVTTSPEIPTPKRPRASRPRPLSTSLTPSPTWPAAPSRAPCAHPQTSTEPDA